MKYEFKEGQWFDIRKFTDWQKQWCLDNLNFLSPSEADFERRSFNLWLYSEWTGLGYLFGSTSEHCCDSENEITFNDFYWGESEEVSQELVFDKPKYVTFNAVADDMGCFLDTLIDGKDYKISSVKTTRHGKTYTLENGIRAHEYFFHKVTPQDLLPAKCEDDEASFDNLVYVEPEDDCRIKVEILSDEQKSFLNDTLNWEDSDRFLTLCTSDFKNLRYCSTNKSWWLSICAYECSEQDTSFNELFQEVN